MIDSLNLYSHNQLFRQWELYTPTADIRNDFDDSTIKAIDTIDFRNEYQLYNQSFFDSLLNGQTLIRWFIQHKHNNLISRIANRSAIRTKKYGEIGYIALLLDCTLPLDKNGRKQLAIADVGGIFAWLGVSANWQDRAHEFGHLLNLEHTFSETDDNGKFHANFRIPEYQTRNFMDYAQGVDLTNMFYYAQWINIH